MNANRIEADEIPAVQDAHVAFTAEINGEDFDQTLVPLTSHQQWNLAKRIVRHSEVTRRCDCGKDMPFIPGKFECADCESVIVSSIMDDSAVAA